MNLVLATSKGVRVACNDHYSWGNELKNTFLTKITKKHGVMKEHVEICIIGGDKLETWS